jgi:hypothetical protein
LLRSASFEIQTLAGAYPWIFLPLARLKRRRLNDPHPLSPQPIEEGTGIVIEGFPRSGNTFAVAAFLDAQPQPISVAHHLHAPAQIHHAARLGIPALVLVRDPVEAVVSLAIREPHISLLQGLRAYARFYRRLHPGRSSFVLADFEDTTRDFGAVIKRVNAHFDRRFGVFRHTQENVTRCFRKIEDRNRQLSGGVISESAIARPSASRSEKARILRERLEERQLASRINVCRALRQQLIDDCKGAGVG